MSRSKCHPQLELRDTINCHPSVRQCHNSTNFIDVENQVLGEEFEVTFLNEGAWNVGLMIFGFLKINCI